MARTTSSMLPWVTIAAWMGCVATPAESIPASSTSHEPGHEQLSLESKVLGELRRVNIYLPPDYRRSTTSRYPILYMPDGGTQEDFPHLTETVDAAIRRGDIRPIIVVGIENTQRRRDLTGPTEVAADREIAPVVGGSAAFRGFLREELLPSIEARLRGNGERAIIGESLAGLFVVETLFVEPQLFDVYVAIDPSLWWNDGELGKRAAERLGAGVGEGRTLYLTAAGKPGESNLEAVEPLVDALEAHAPEHLRWTWAPLLDESHATIYRASKLAILKALFPSGA